ncbi:MAG: protein kinase [Thermomicrobiales bacterium]
MQTLRSARVLNRRYRLDKRTRVSQESESFLAFDALLQRSVTLEMPNTARQAPDIFVYRRQIASALHHRNILATLDIGEDSGTPYVVSEYFAGDTLRSIIADEAPFDVDDVAILIEQLAQGLAYAHSRGIVHGSLTPETVIVDSAGLAKITGFGMIEGQMVSETGSRAAIPDDPYLPRTLRGNSLITQALDVHSLAAIAFEMLSGTEPKVEQGYVSPTVLNPQVSPRAGETVLIGLQAHESRSGLTATQFSHALTNWRSWTMQHPADEPHAMRAFHLQDQVPAPLPPAFAWPQPTTSRQRSASVATGQRPGILRWLAIGLLVVIVAATAIVYRIGDKDSIAGLPAIPEELTQLITSLSD